MPEAWQKVCMGTCFGVVLLISIILFAVSFSTLEPNEMGLDCNNNRKFVDSTELYTSGRHFLGLGHNFIVFPKNQQETSLQLLARSSKGAEVRLSCNFQWQLIDEIEYVYQLWSLFDEEYPKAFEKIAKDALRNVAARYTATDYFFQRSNITQDMSDSLTKTLLDLGAQVSGFQLLNFDVPQAFSDTVTLTEETKQKKTRALTLQEKAVITAEQRIATAQEDARILRLNARAAAVAFVQEKNATRESILTRFTAETSAYKNMKERLSLDNDELLSIIWLSAISGSEAPQTLAVAYPGDIGKSGDNIAK